MVVEASPPLPGEKIMIDSQKPILVTGAGGCIGAWVVARLLARGQAVVALDRTPDRRRLVLAAGAEAAGAVPWEIADITEPASVAEIVGRCGIGGIIHLAALQIPFCAADPSAGARVNVAGHVHVLEAARQAGIGRVIYASSVAAQAVPGRPGPDTLYGIFKHADEGVARIYWQDWGVASIGLRPHTVYGPGRDQGLTSAPTAAMRDAALGRPCTIALNSTFMMQHVHEVADAFIACAGADFDGAHVHDLAGSRATSGEIAEAIRAVLPDAEIGIGDQTVVFPLDQDDTSLRARVGDWPHVPLGEGVRITIEAFQTLAHQGLIDTATV